MICKKFNNIKIKNCFGVSPVGRDSRCLVKNAKKQEFKTALDLGCGTGFSAIYLKSLGFETNSCDLNPLTVNCAKECG